ncbi:hypothetical protein ROZALSC1DRAFT_28663, partial [Rozella allomycis CSF55]
MLGVSMINVLKSVFSIKDRKENVNEEDLTQILTFYENFKSERNLPAFNELRNIVFKFLNENTFTLQNLKVLFYTAQIDDTNTYSKFLALSLLKQVVENIGTENLLLILSCLYMLVKQDEEACRLIQKSNYYEKFRAVLLDCIKSCEPTAMPCLGLIFLIGSPNEIPCGSMKKCSSVEKCLKMIFNILSRQEDPILLCLASDFISMLFNYDEIVLMLKEKNLDNYINLLKESIIQANSIDIVFHNFKVLNLFIENNLGELKDKTEIEDSILHHINAENEVFHLNLRTDLSQIITDAENLDYLELQLNYLKFEDTLLSEILFFLDKSDKFLPKRLAVLLQDEFITDRCPFVILNLLNFSCNVLMNDKYYSNVIALCKRLINSPETKNLIQPLLVNLLGHHFDIVFSAFTSSSHQSDNRNVEQMEFEIQIQHQMNQFEIELQEKQNEIDCLKQKLEKSDKLINSILKEKSDNEEKLK